MDLDCSIVTSLVIDCRLPGSLLWMHDQVPLLSALQRVHDLSPIAEWEKEFQSVAEKHNLKFNSK